LKLKSGIKGQARTIIDIVKCYSKVDFCSVK
jgi:hypothetical protein